MISRLIARHLARPPTPSPRAFRPRPNNGAALGVGHGGPGLPKTAGHATARRLEFGVDVLGAGLQSGQGQAGARRWVKFWFCL